MNSIYLEAVEYAQEFAALYPNIWKENQYTLLTKL